MVVIVDDPAATAPAVAWAAQEAAARRAVLRMIGRGIGPSALDLVGADVRRRHPALVVVGECIGRAALCDVETAADLVVVGAVVGSTAGALPASAAGPRRGGCPIVVVGAVVDAPPRRILVAVDAFGAAAAALEWAAVEAVLHDADLAVLGAWLPPAGAGPVSRRRDLARAEATALVDRAAERTAQRSGRPVTGHVVEGGAADVIRAASVDVDLTVVGSRGRSGFATLQFGSVARSTMTHARSTVVVIHPPRRARSTG